MAPITLEQIVPAPLPIAPEPTPEPVAPVATAAPVAPAPLATQAAAADEPVATVAVTKPVIKRSLDEIAQNARRLFATNRIDEAEAAYRKVLAINASQVAALVGLARIQLTRGQLDEALTLAQRAAEKAPDQASSHLALGDVLRARGDKAGAQAQYELASLRSATKAASESKPSAE